MANETDFSDFSASNLQYDWSNPNNWSAGLPVDGDNVVVNGAGDDDLGSLTLNDLTLTAGSSTEVLDSTLIVSDVIDDGGAALQALGLSSEANTAVTVEAATGPVNFGAFGYAQFTDNSTDDFGTYAATAGGKVVVAAAPVSSDIFEFADGTLVLAGAQAGTITSQITGLGNGDTIVLPGTAGSLSQVGFGSNSLSITTSAGMFDFTSVTYESNAFPGGYTVSYAAGLVSITLEPPVDVFSDNTTGTAGTFDWNTGSNWSSGTVPASDSGVQTNASGDDNIAGFSVDNLYLEGHTSDVVTDGLTVDNLISDGGSLVADQQLSGGSGGFNPSSVTVTVDADSGGAVNFGAIGASGLFTDQSTTDSGTYSVSKGGTIVVSSNPASGSTFTYALGDGTIALVGARAGTIGSALQGFQAADTLEVPGDTGSVSQVSFTTGGLSITTDRGTFNFTDVSYGSEGTLPDGLPSGYTVGYDFATNADTITLLPVDVFQPVTFGPSGPNWSIADNWAAGVPADGEDVYVAGNGNDNISSLSVVDLYLNGYTTDAVTNSLTVNDVISANGSLIADESLAGKLGGEGNESPTSVSVTVLADSGGAVNFGASGVGGLFTDDSTTDAGFYSADAGGKIIVSSDPAGGSTFSYGTGGGTIALAGAVPGTIGSAIQGLGVGDTIELPGAEGSVGPVSFTASGMSITSSAGTFNFSNVTYGGTGLDPAGLPAGYTVGYDSGLVSITLQPLPVFVGDAAEGKGGYGWANAAAWNTGAVPTGGEVQMDHNGTDNIPSLTLTDLYLNGYSTIVGDSYLLVDDLDSDGAALNAETTGASDTNVYVLATSDGPVDFDATGEAADAANAATITDYSTTDSGFYSVTQNGEMITYSNPTAASTYSFNYGGGTIALAGAAAGTIDAQLEGLAVGDTLELPGTAGSIGPVSFTPDGVSITTSAGIFDFDQVTYAASGIPTAYTTTYDNYTDLEAVTIACYLRGTHILSARGDVAIETLRIGDRVVTRDKTLKPIKWIGRRRFGDGNLDVQPILIRESALAPEVPRRDLRVSPEHAMFIDGVLIPATDLVNGNSIVKVEDLEVVEYFHIELETHDVVYAEGAASETFVDDDSRRMFQNAHEYAARYPDDISEPAVFCAPRLIDGYALETVRERLVLRALARSAPATALSRGQSMRAADR